MISNKQRISCILRGLMSDDSDDFFDLRENLQKNLEENFVKAQQFIRIFPVFFFSNFIFPIFLHFFLKELLMFLFEFEICLQFNEFLHGALW